MNWIPAIIGSRLALVFTILVVIIFCMLSRGESGIVVLIPSVFFSAGWLGIFIVLWIGIGHFLSDDFCSQRNPGATRTVIAIVVFLVIATPMMIVLATLIVFAPEFIYFWPIVALFGLPMLALSICFAILQSLNEESDHCTDLLDVGAGFSWVFLITVIPTILALVYWYVRELERNSTP